MRKYRNTSFSYAGKFLQRLLCWPKALKKKMEKLGLWRFMYVIVAAYFAYFESCRVYKHP